MIFAMYAGMLLTMLIAIAADDKPSHEPHVIRSVG